MLWIVHARTHWPATKALLEGARQALREAGWPEDRVQEFSVAGVFEIPQFLASAWKKGRRPEGVCTIGIVMRGETEHHALLAESVFHALHRLAQEYGIPITLGIITVENWEQAFQRAGGKLGNKGYEAMRALLDLRKKLQ